MVLEKSCGNCSFMVLVETSGNLFYSYSEVISHSLFSFMLRDTVSIVHVIIAIVCYSFFIVSLT